jgi:hypothetical protein
LYRLGAAGAVCHHLGMLIERHGLACDFDDAVEALEYWRGRRARLAWHRRADRREADAMVDAWERRVRRAALTDPALPLARRLEAGVLVLRTRGGIVGRRWRRRAYVGGVAMAGAAGAGFAAVASLF